jgi:thiamine pyrophosphate-dependent acetolactate synthase large subunit-like protein
MAGRQGPADRRGYEVIADLLVAAGVTDLFGVMGEGNLELITTLQSGRGVRYHATRHENGAVAAAHGYAQAGRRLGVATVTHGPGLTNAMTALVSAARLPAPVVVIVGDVANESDGHVQAIDHEAVALVAGASTERARSGVVLAGVVSRALHRATTEERTIVLVVPVDVQEAVCPPGPTDRRYPTVNVSRAPADPDAVERAAAAIDASSRPVILAGRGAERSGARPVLERLAHAVGAPLGTTLLAKGLFAGHPHDLGVVGGYATPMASEVLGNADLVLAFGASLNGFTTRAGTMFSSATVVHCDHAHDVIGRSHPVDIGLVGDAATVATQLVERVAERPDTAERRRSLGVRFQSPESPGPLTAADPAGSLHPERVCVSLDDVLPPDRMLAVDGGHFTQFPCTWIGVPDPAGFVFTLGFGSVGLGLGAGIGAAVARPDRVCVTVVGDGGFMMALPELETAARQLVPMLVVVMDDGAYGAEIHHLRARGRPLDAAQFATPDVVALAEACGAEGIALRGPADIDQVRRRVLGGLEGPLVAHARIDPTIVSPWFSGLVDHAARFIREGS